MTLRPLLLSAAAAAALAAGAALAHEPHDCADAACDTSLLFQAAPTGAGGAGGLARLARATGPGASTCRAWTASVKPGDDFFRFANGTWSDRATIPADRTRFGNFDALAILSEARVRADPRGGRGRQAHRPRRAPRSARPTPRFMDEAAGREAGRQADRPRARRSPQGEDQGRVHRPDGQVQPDRLRLDPAGGHHHRRQGARPLRRDLPARRAWACPTATTTCSPASRREEGQVPGLCRSSS